MHCARQGTKHKYTKDNTDLQSLEIDRSLTTKSLLAVEEGLFGRAA